MSAKQSEQEHFNVIGIVCPKLVASIFELAWEAMERPPGPMQYKTSHVNIDVSINASDPTWSYRATVKRKLLDMRRRDEELDNTIGQMLTRQKAGNTILTAEVKLCDERGWRGATIRRAAWIVRRGEAAPTHEVRMGQAKFAVYYHE